MLWSERVTEGKRGHLEIQPSASVTQRNSEIGPGGQAFSHLECRTGSGQHSGSVDFDLLLGVGAQHPDTFPPRAGGLRRGGMSSMANFMEVLENRHEKFLHGLPKLHTPSLS